MRSTTSLAAASAVAFTLLAVTVSPPALASETGHEHLQTLRLDFRTVAGVDRPTTAVARGPVNDRGTETQNNEVELPDGESGNLTIHLSRGDWYGHYEEHHFALDYDPATCTGVATSDGTMTFTGGSGRYAEIHGTLTFTARGLLVAARDASGACLGPESGVDPASVHVVIDASGHLDD